MSLLTELMVEKLRKLLSPQNPNYSLSDLNEEVHAVRYLKDLVLNTTDQDLLERSLTRFFRIRPNKDYSVQSTVSAVYKLLFAVKFFPNTPLTAEEQLLSDFLKVLFSPSAPKKTNGQYQELSTVNPDALNSVDVYKIAVNVTPEMEKLAGNAVSFDWNKPHYLTGNTHLHDAVNAKDLNKITLLLNAGANPRLTNTVGSTPLGIALKSQNNDVILRFITSTRVMSSLTKDEASHIFDVLVVDLKSTDKILIKAFLSTDGFNPLDFINNQKDANEHRLLEVAASCGELEITKMLLDKGVSPDHVSKAGNTALSVVASRHKIEYKPDHLAIAKLLLNSMNVKAVNAITQNNKTALEWAAAKGAHGIVLLLLNYKDIQMYHDENDENDENVLLLAVRNHWVDAIQLILAKDTEKKLLNQRDSRSLTPLIHAVADGSLEITNMLLVAGADPSIKSGANTALSIVAGRGPNQKKPDHPAIAALLLEVMKPSDVNDDTQDNKTALEWAISQGNVEIVLLLINYDGINLDKKMKGKTIHQIADEMKWPLVKKALKANSLKERNKPEVQSALEARVAALEQEVRELKAIVATLTPKEGATASSAVGAPVRLSIDTAGNVAGKPSLSPRHGVEAKQE